MPAARGRAHGARRAAPRPRPGASRRRRAGRRRRGSRRCDRACDAQRRRADRAPGARSSARASAFMRAPADPDALRSVARRAIAVFEAIGSDADLADAWQLMGVAELAAARQRRAARGARAGPWARDRVGRHAPPDRGLERGRRRDALRPDASGRGALLPGRGARLGTCARPCGGRGGRAARRPVPLRAHRPLRRGSRPARALEGDLPRAGNRVRARRGAHGGGRDGDAGRGRGGRGAGVTRGDPRGGGDGRVAVRRPLPHPDRPRPRRAGQGR